MCKEAIHLEMPRKPCYWTRKLELQLVEFVRQRDFIWKLIGNTNHHIHQKYKAYAEFAATLGVGRGFTARSVRDRWVNIRSTFHHNYRRVEKSKLTAASEAEVYIPSWPLWKPLQFLTETIKKDKNNEEPSQDLCTINVFKEETQYDIEENFGLLVPLKEQPIKTSEEPHIGIREKPQQIPKSKRKSVKRKKIVCKQIIDDLIMSVRPLVDNGYNKKKQSNWYFGKYVTETLNSMQEEDALCAREEILKLLKSWPNYDTKEALL